MITIQIQRHVVSKLVTITSVFDYCGVDYSFHGAMLCPFHEDTSHPSARMYSGDRGQSLFCFAEHKTYTSYDAIRLLTSQNVEKVFYKIWDTLSPSEKDDILLEMGQPIETLPAKWVERKGLLVPFQSGTMNLREYKTVLLEIITGEGDI